ncbi:MAG: hypothetical protein M1541_03745 [Acidobacteria bacterium]|nr:hypothetical protein [Acidobacteriota bacterium]
MKTCLILLLAAAGLNGAGDDFLRWDAKRANAVLTAQRSEGRVGGALDLRVLRTDRSYNYKLRATWMTPEAIRAGARLEQLKKALTDQETLRLVADAESAGDTVIYVEVDPREGSGVIPNDWTALLSPHAGSGNPLPGVRGTNTPRLRDLPALAGYGRRDYAYDVFWVVFPLHTESGAPLFGEECREAELTVRIYDKAGRVRWRIPDSIRLKMRD